jgi:transcription termination factor NusB
MSIFSKEKKAAPPRVREKAEKELEKMRKYVSDIDNGYCSLEEYATNYLSYLDTLDDLGHITSKYKVDEINFDVDIVREQAINDMQYDLRKAMRKIYRSEIEDLRATYLGLHNTDALKDAPEDARQWQDAIVNNIRKLESDIQKYWTFFDSNTKETASDILNKLNQLKEEEKA